MENIKFLTPMEKKELFNRIDNDTGRHAIRNRAMFYIGAYCALRASEIPLLQLDEYDPLSGSIFCHRLKNGRNNMLRIVDCKTLYALQDYLKIYHYYHMTNSGPLFKSQECKPISRKSLDHLMKQYCTGTSIPKEKRHFHVLRHTRAIEILETTGNIFDVQFWLGHKNIQNTMLYLHYTTLQHERLYRLLEQSNVKEVN